MKRAHPNFVAVACGCTLLILASQAGADEVGGENAAPTRQPADEIVEQVAEPDPAADAEEREPAARGIEVIVVTAQKRESVVQETPVAITAFDQTQLDQRGVSDLQGLSFNVPNFHYGEVLGNARITIRGISTAGGDQAAAFHIDGIYQNSSLIPSSLTFFDLERVETLRGPQGTLAGRNATGGAIFVVTQKPEFDFKLFGDVQLGNYHELITRGVLNIPIVEDKVAARVSFIKDRHYGYTENLHFDVRSRDVDDQDLLAVRGQIRVKPIESLDWVVRGVYSKGTPNGGGVRVDGSLPAGVAVAGLPNLQNFYGGASPNPTDVREIYLDTPESTVTFLKGASTTLTWDAPRIPLIGDTAVTLLGGWQMRKQTSLSDVDRTNAPCAPGFSVCPPGVNFDLVRANTIVKQEEWVAEANWATQNSEGEPFSAVLGAFYLGTRNSLDFATRSSLFFNLPPPVETIRSLGVASTDSLNAGSAKSIAGFMDLSYEFFDQLTLTGGLRYSVDWKEEERIADRINITFLNPGFVNFLNLFLPGGFSNPLCLVEGLVSDQDDRWEAWTGRAKARWQYTDDNMLYGSFSRGYKAGTIEHTVPNGCNPPIPLNNTDPETINAYEIGFKNNFFDHRLQANLTGFYYDYDNIQVATLVQSTVITQNAAGAEAAGVEVELVGLPVDELLLTANFAYLYTKFTDYKNGCLVEDASTCVPGGFLDFTGNILPRAPRMSGTVTAQYTLDLGRFGSLIPFAQIYASDKVFFRASNFDGDVVVINGVPEVKTDTQKAYWLLDARLGWESPNGTLGIEAFVANALDKDIVNTRLISTPLLGSPEITVYAPPRTFGGRLTMRW